MPPITSIANWLLRLPLLWGGLATLAFYAAAQSGMFAGGILARYCGLQPASAISMLLFFVGLIALTMRLADVLVNFGAVRLTPLGRLPADGQSVSETPYLLTRL